MSFKIPSSNIKPYNPIPENKQLYYLQKNSQLGNGPVQIPQVSTNPTMPHPAIAFQKLKMLMAKGK